MKKIVVASDSFKGCLSSLEVAEAVEKGILGVFPDCDVVKVSVADGGEGTAEAVVAALGGTMQEVTVHDPLGRRIRAAYGMVEERGVRAAAAEKRGVKASGDGLVDELGEMAGGIGGAEGRGVINGGIDGGEGRGGKTAVIEMAAASGLTLLGEQERNPLLTSTAGTGELIMDAISRGCRRFLVGIGGSATNDAGTGMLHALGNRFRDSDGNELDCCGASLGRIAYIDELAVPQAVRESEFIVACDVETPFCGPDGAAFTFAPQKGASPETVRELDAGMHSFAEVIRRQYGTDIIPVKGSGAAGGLGGAFKVFLGARLVRGIDMVLDAVRFDDILKGADLVITGEGRIDSQTPQGKTPAGILRRAALQDIPVVAIAGQVAPCEELSSMGLRAICPINAPSTPLEQAMRPSFAAGRITATVSDIMKSL